MFDVRLPQAPTGFCLARRLNGDHVRTTIKLGRGSVGFAIYCWLARHVGQYDREWWVDIAQGEALFRFTRERDAIHFRLRWSNLG